MPFLFRQNLIFIQKIDRRIHHDIIKYYMVKQKLKNYIYKFYTFYLLKTISACFMRLFTIKLDNIANQ